jgi:internalin A
MPTSNDAYQQAEELIKKAIQNRSPVLRLNGLGLTELPLSLAEAQLDTLDLSANVLTEVPNWIGDFVQLDSLYLYGNRLTTLPEEFGKLAKLRTLYLFSNQFGELPDCLRELKLLETLFVSTNHLIVVPDWLGELESLRTLNLTSNNLTKLPESIGRLKSLRMLNVARNQLTVLPESLTDLTSLTELYLQDNPELGLSADILGAEWHDMAEKKRADPQALLRFYFAQQQRTAKPLNEFKLLLVGHGRVGKTSLSKALRDIEHDEREPETPGIERHTLPLTAGRTKLTAHVWDFGGQEFLHQTHQFFFSERSIYLVVLSGRQGRPMQEAEYWLRLIRTYGSGSPVVIALNQVKTHPFSVDEHFLEENYPEVQAIVKTDCDPRVGIDELRKALGKLAGEMPSVRERIEPGWARVRKRLEEMSESFVTFEEYRKICAEEGVTSLENQETLATILDCLGIALNYREDPRLRDTSVLKPRWLVDGIYSVLRWLHQNETNGELKLADFPKALTNTADYPATMHQFLLALMEKFELCFPLQGKDLYLVPGLLDENQPGELKKEFMTGEARRIQFRYDDVRPPGLLPRFIVRSHTLSEKQPRWLRGVVLVRGKARALVRGDHEGRLTDVFALGESEEDRIWLTEFILAEMRSLHDKLPVRTLVETGGAWTDLEVLRADANREATSRIERSVEGHTITVHVKETLRAVETPEATRQALIPAESLEADTSASGPLPLFICYAHVNERIVRQLIPGLKVLARRGYIAAWRDTDLVPGEEWDDTIKQRLSEAQIILFMVSRQFLASDYITTYERPLAMELVKQKKAVVVPVLLADCLWKDEDFSRLEKLPRKDEPISSFSPRDAAWTLVENGLVKVVEKKRKKPARFGGLGSFS